MTAPTTRIPVAARGKAPVFHGAGLTDRGAVRAENEDAILTDPTGIIWAVADGMGGYGNGDVASDSITRFLSEIGDEDLAIPALRTGLQAANADIQRQSAKRGIGPIGATVVAMMFQNSIAHIVWAGDCRAYLMRQRCLKLLTRDHTVVQDMVDQGLLDSAARENHPEAHVVTRAVGYEPQIELDALSVPVVPGDVILLCSDGLTGCLGDHELADHMAAASNPDALCKALVSAALERGATDNVSVISVFATEGE